MSEVIVSGGVVLETVLPVSIPSGGATGQVLVKKSNLSYDIGWAAGGTGGSGTGDMLKSTYDPDNDGKISYVDLSNKPSLSQVATSGSYNDLLNKPSLGTAAFSNVPITGNASVIDLVKGNDTRLTDARAPLSHTHVINDVTGLQVVLDGKQPTISATGILKSNGSVVSQAQSGVDIKTIGGVSILGSGDISIGGTGTVTNVSVTSANGFNASVSNSTTNAAISISTTVNGLVKGNGTSLSAAIAGTDFLLPTGSGSQLTGLSAGQISGVELSSNKDATGGYAGLTNYKINIRNTANTITSFLSNSNTVSRNYVLPDRDGVIADATDIATRAPVNSPTFTGTVNIPTGAIISGYAQTASPTLSGVPLTPTAAVDTNNSQIASTAYVINQGYLKSSVAGSTYATIASLGTAASATVTTTSVDVTANRVLRVGDYGLGTAPISSDNWNTVTASGKYRNTLTSATGIPEAVAGLLMAHTNIDNNTATQIAFNSTSGSVSTRNKVSGTWGAWAAASGGGGGGLSSVSFTSANGFTGTVANPTTSPAITVATSVTGILKGNGTAISAAVSGTDFKTVNGTSILGSGDITVSGGSGSVTGVSVASVNGFTGTVATPSTTPVISVSTSVTGVLKGNGVGILAAVSGTDYLAPSALTSSNIDVTAGKILKVGDYGLGTTPVVSNNWDTIAVGGKYVNTSTSATGIPLALAGLNLTHTYIDSVTATQVAWDITNNVMYARRKTASTWSAWSAGVSAGVSAQLQTDVNTLKLLNPYNRTAVNFTDYFSGAQSGAQQIVNWVPATATTLQMGGHEVQVNLGGAGALQSGGWVGALKSSLNINRSASVDKALSVGSYLSVQGGTTVASALGFESVVLGLDSTSNIGTYAAFYQANVSSVPNINRIGNFFVLGSDYPEAHTKLTGNYYKSQRTVSGDKLREIAPARHAGYVTGRYYGASNRGAVVGGGGSAILANTIYAVPFYCVERTTFTEIGVRVTAAIAASNLRLGIYYAEGGQPSDRIFQSADIATATTGLKTSSMSVKLESGYYFLVLHASAAISVNWVTVNGLLEQAGTTTDTGAETSVYQSLAFGTGLPSVFTPSGFSDTSLTLPHLWLRK